MGPHPHLFKQDADLTLNQITLLSDQYMQAMRKFDFLTMATNTMSNLITTVLRFNEFLAKKLYQYMKIEGTESSSGPIGTLCFSCGKLRENEKIRSLKEDLRVSRNDWNMARVKKEIVLRLGEKYDV